MARTEPGMVSPLARPTKADSSICCQHAGLTPARAAGHLPAAVQGLPPPLRAGPRDECGASPRVGFALPRPWTASTSLSPAPAVAITCRGRGFPSPLSPVARPWKPQGAQGGAQMARPVHHTTSARRPSAQDGAPVAVARAIRPRPRRRLALRRGALKTPSPSPVGSVDLVL